MLKSPELAGRGRLQAGILLIKNAGLKPAATSVMQDWVFQHPAKQQVRAIMAPLGVPAGLKMAHFSVFKNVTICHNC